MTKQDKIRIFLRWLKEHNLYFKYLRGASRNYGEPIRSIVFTLMERLLDSKLSAKSFIDYTIWWSQTVEGQSFWAEKNYAWERFYEEINRR